MAIPDLLTASPSSKGLDIGTIQTVDGSWYQWVKSAAGIAVAYTSGSPCYSVWSNSGLYYVTVDSSDANELNHVMGVVNSAMTTLPDSATNRYFWMKVKGEEAKVKKASSGVWATGDAIIGSTTDRICANVASGTAPTNKVIGWCKSACLSGTTTAVAYIDML